MMKIGDQTPAASEVDQIPLEQEYKTINDQCYELLSYIKKDYRDILYIATEHASKLNNIPVSAEPVGSERAFIKSRVKALSKHIVASIDDICGQDHRTRSVGVQTDPTITEDAEDPDATPKLCAQDARRPLFSRPTTLARQPSPLDLHAFFSSAEQASPQTRLNQISGGHAPSPAGQTTASTPEGG